LHPRISARSFRRPRALVKTFAERSVELTVDLPEHLPLAPADSRYLDRIIAQLLDNACKYTCPGGHIAVRARSLDGYIQVDVQDTGVGIGLEAQPHIFRPFFRADNPLRDQVDGIGLGLAIAQRLVELHGGRIWFVSAEGQGSAFSFTLPIAAPGDAACNDRP
jgi:signal transduction histidine kinase